RALDGDSVRLGRRLADVRERLASGSAASSSASSASSSASSSADIALNLVSGTSHDEWVQRV
ncbi:MAG TPA: hypothetical protein VIR16_08315, partial [Candidatus Limnocylindrales bacterium]